MLHLRRRLSGSSIIAVTLFAALAVAGLAQQERYVMPATGTPAGSSLSEPECSYSVFKVCLVRRTTDGWQPDQFGDVVFYDDDDFGIGFYREVLERELRTPDPR
jgi:hypothetical protein